MRTFHAIIAAATAAHLRAHNRIDEDGFKQQAHAGLAALASQAKSASEAYFNWMSGQYEKGFGQLNGAIDAANEKANELREELAAGGDAVQAESDKVQAILEMLRAEQNKEFDKLETDAKEAVEHLDEHIDAGVLELKGLTGKYQELAKEQGLPFLKLWLEEFARAQEQRAAGFKAAQAAIAAGASSLNGTGLVQPGVAEEIDAGIQKAMDEEMKQFEQIKGVASQLQMALQFGLLKPMADSKIDEYVGEFRGDVKPLADAGLEALHTGIDQRKKELEQVQGLYKHGLESVADQLKALSKGDAEE